MRSKRKRTAGAALAWILCLSLIPGTVIAKERTPDPASEIASEEDRTVSAETYDAQLILEDEIEETAGPSESEGPEEAKTEEGPGPVKAVSGTEAEEIYRIVGDALYAEFSEKGSYGYEWNAIELARAGYPVNPDYISSLTKKVKDTGGVLHTSKSNYTEYAKAVMAFTACGLNPRNVEGYDLVVPLADFDSVSEQGANGVMYALLALDSYNYRIPEKQSGTTQTTREGLIEAILSARLSDGGWDFSMRSADPDMTAMALQALAPYYDSEDYPQVRPVIDEVVELISSMQTEEGMFCSPDAAGNPTSESSAQVILALTALGIDPDRDERFIKNGNSAIDGLCAFRSGDGFAHVLEGSKNALSTVQGYYALVSYFRTKEGKTSFYDMTDVELKGSCLKSAELESGSFAYTGAEIRPDAVVIGVDGEGNEVVLSPGTDYSVVYEKNINAGTAKMIVDGEGDYRGSSLIRSFVITPVKLSSVKAEGASYTYTGSKIKPSVTVKAKAAGKTVTLQNKTDYKLTYQNNTRVGDAKITVTGVGNFTGTITKSFQILPTAVRFSSVKAGKKSLTLKWTRKKPEATGYQYQYSLKNTFPSGSTTSKKVKIASKSGSSITETVKGLKTGKTYYARIRSYTVSGGKTYYSSWSAVRKAVVK